MTSTNFMVIGFQIRKLHRGGGIRPPPAVLDSKRPGLFRVKVQCLKVFCYHGNKSTILLFIQFLEQLLKFLANYTLLKYVKSQRSYGFLITKKLIFGFQILDLKVHFSASLRYCWQIKTRSQNLKATFYTPTFVILAPHLR